MKIKMTIEQAVEQLDSLSRERKHKIQVNDGIAISLVLRELNRLREQLRQRDEMLAAVSYIVFRDGGEIVLYNRGWRPAGPRFKKTFDTAPEAYAATKALRGE
jgi:hypothetical protein